MLTFMTLLATFTAWAIISSVSDVNARCVLRSSIGLHASGLPSKTIVLALYTCLTWMTLFMWYLVPEVWGITVTVCTISFLFHIITVYSALGKLIMYTGAMGPKRILEERVEEQMLPFELHDALVEKAIQRRKNKVRLSAQYEENYDHLRVGEP